MSTVLSQPKGFAFKKNLPLLHSAGSLGFDVTSASPKVLTALLSDEGEFAPGDIDLADVKLTASTPKPIQFGLADAKVSFTAQGSVFAGFGLYEKGGALLKKLGAQSEDFSLDALEFNIGAKERLAVLRWGYDAATKASGAVALGALGTATFKAAGSRDGVFAVIRRVPTTMKARQTIQTVTDSWIMPRQIASIDQLEPGTWIIAEVAGALSVSLGAQVGYDFNWVREAKLGGLTGDIGLRLQMGIDAAIGYSSSGRCAVVVSRDSDAKALRLRFFRLKTRQLDLSFNASLSVQAKDKLLPGKVDDFIAAVFDVHGQQIVRDLKVLEKWTNPSNKLSDLLAEAGVNGAENLIAHLAGVSPDELQERFDEVHKKAVSFVKRWNDLPHTVSSTLMKLVEDKVDLTDVRAIAKDLSTIDEQGLKKLLDRQLDRVDFFHSPVGKVLESVADGPVLKLLSKPLAEVNDIAKKVIGILDGSTLENTLASFQDYIEKELHLDKVLNAVTQTDFKSLDALLKRKLSNFLGKELKGLEELEEVRRTIHLLLGKREEYYKKALEALHRKYTFSLTASSQTTTTDQALFDGTFDFSHDPAAVSSFFQQAIEGRLDELLQVQPKQVTIAQGLLTHGVRRQTQVDVTLPFLKTTKTHINESVATMNAVAREGGLLFTLKASDAVITSNRRKSVLSLAMALSRTTGTSIRVHQESLELNYSLLYVKRNMKVDDVRAQITPALTTFFRHKIESPDEFLSVLDEQAEAAIPDRPELGNGLISLDVSVSPTAAPAIGRAWLALPPKRSHEMYGTLSTALQASLKEHMHDAAFTTRQNYDTVGVERTQLFLGYCALVPRAEKAPKWFWDWPSVDERKVMLRNPRTVARMRTFLEHAQDVLRGGSLAGKFKPGNASAILQSIDADDPFLNSLLAAENEVIQDAIGAGVAMAKAQKSAPTEAVEALEEFGSKLTEAFHGDISTMLGPGMQSLGTLVLLDTARSIGVGAQETNAILNLEFLKPAAEFNPEALLSAGRVPQPLLAFADRLVNIA